MTGTLLLLSVLYWAAFRLFPERDVVVVADGLLGIMSVVVALQYVHYTPSVYLKPVTGLFLIRCGIVTAWLAMAVLSCARVRFELSYAPGDSVFALFRELTVVPAIYAALLHILAVGMVTEGRLVRGNIKTAVLTFFGGLTFMVLFDLAFRL